MESVETVSTPDLIKHSFALGAIQVKEEITEFVDFLRKQSLRNIMEIGSEAGGTFYLWCQITALGGLKISLDKPDGESGSWLYKEPDALAKRTKLFQSFAPRVKVVTGDSHSVEIQSQIADILNGEKLDFLFIDGDHSYEGVKADWEMYRSFVRQGGFVAFHDIQHLGPEVLWKEIREEYAVADRFAVANQRESRIREFNSKLHWAGIGVIEV